MRRKERERGKKKKRKMFCREKYKRDGPSVKVICIFNGKKH
jgi:hypothetical protein